jgi:DNA polymerase (family 10)
VAPIDNAEVAAILVEIADLMQIRGTQFHRVNAFRRAARIVKGLREPVATMVESGALADTPGIGKGTLKRIGEILATGTCKDLRELRSKVPPGLRDMLSIKGVGPSTVRTVWESLDLSTVDELEVAAKDGRLVKAPRMGSASVEKILRGIQSFRRRKGRVPLSTAMRRATSLLEALKDLEQVERIELAGSIRRGRDTVGDIDILVCGTQPEPVIECFVGLTLVDEVLSRGELASSVRLHSLQQADLRVLPPESFGAALHYFTGSAQHNVAIRGRAKAMGLRVNEHGIYDAEDGSLRVECRDEAQVFEAVGLPWIPPELREDAGEIQAAEQGSLPKIVGMEDLRGDLHMHTTASDGRGSAMEMVEQARALGFEYIAITEHSQTLSFAGGLDEGRVALQLRELRELQEDTDDLRIAAGTEVDILPDGSLDLDSRLLAQLDWVVASVHLNVDMPMEAMTGRIVAALESGLVDCLGHPTGRRPARRDPYPVDLERIFAVAKKTGVALECNGGPNRMDLSDVACRRARELGIPIAINTDAHSPWNVGRMEYGLAMARRGWLEAEHVLNTRPWQEIAQRRADRMRRHGIQVPADYEPQPAAPEERPEGSGDEEEVAHAWG